MVMGWAARLGLFLFARILHDGEDKRFVRAKEDPSLFFKFWTIQGKWVEIDANIYNYFHPCKKCKMINYINYTCSLFLTMIELSLYGRHLGICYHASNFNAQFK